MLKGNHEDIESAGTKFSHVSFAENIKVLDKYPYEVINFEDLEIIALPYQKSFKGNIDFPIKTKKRVLIAHGIVEGTMWSLEDGEAMSSVPINLIKKINPDLSFVGHIHKHMEINCSGLNIIYVGSSRVWRRSKSEMGKRVCMSLDVYENELKTKSIELKSACEYRVYNLIINDELYQNIEDLSSNWNKNDAVDIYLSGILEDENDLKQIAGDIGSKYSLLVRTFNVRKGNTILLSNEKNENIINDFLEICKEYSSNKMEEEKKEILDMALFMGLERISKYLKKKI